MFMPKVDRETVPAAESIEVVEPPSIADRIEGWKSELRSGLCGENHSKVLSEIDAEKTRLMESGLKSTDDSYEIDMRLMKLTAFENAVKDSLHDKKKIPECASR